jgi:hypothetical protein
MIVWWDCGLWKVDCWACNLTILNVPNEILHSNFVIIHHIDTKIYLLWLWLSYDAKDNCRNGYEVFTFVLLPIKTCHWFNVFLSLSALGPIHRPRQKHKCCPDTILSSVMHVLGLYLGHTFESCNACFAFVPGQHFWVLLCMFWACTWATLLSPVMHVLRLYLGNTFESCYAGFWALQWMRFISITSPNCA